ncbi:MAG: flagellar biosynthesis protein FlhF [Burkholderiales bacterium]|nr:flagellar biosynthesis protein FlhF [Burkholderiales bacterium]
MNVKRIKAKTSREAMVLVRQMLGDEAVILSNRSVAGGVEIMAMPHDELRDVAEPAHFVAPPPASSPANRTTRKAASTTRSAPAARERLPLRDFADELEEAERPLTGVAAYRRHGGHEAPTAASVRKTPHPTTAGAASGFAAPTEQPAPGVLRGQPRRAQHATQDGAQASKLPPEAAAPSAQPAAGISESVARELASLRALVETQLSDLTLQGIATREPARMAVMGELLNSGFSPLLARRVTEKFPVHLDGRDARDWMQASLVRNLRCARAEQDPVAVGGVYALVGPTGVGKTTTIAKLAARALVRHGATQVGLISADNYRIGAQDQLDWYGRMLGIPVRRVRDQDELKAALAAFSDRKLVLIDTAGMSQRDAQVSEQTALLSAEGVRRIVLLNAGAQAETLDDVVRAYIPESERATAQAIVTKLDEAVKLGGVVDCAIRRRLTLLFVTTGQRVPEDMHPAHGRYLVDKALRHAQSPAFARQAAEQRLQLAGTVAPQAASPLVMHSQSNHKPAAAKNATQKDSAHA